MRFLSDTAAGVFALGVQMGSRGDALMYMPGDQVLFQQAIVNESISSVYRDIERTFLDYTTSLSSAEGSAYAYGLFGFEAASLLLPIFQGVGTGLGSLRTITRAEAAAMLNASEVRVQASAAAVLSGRSAAAAENGAARQTFATGKEWYDYLAGRYGAQDVEWVSGSGRTIAWPSELPMPAATQMLRVAPGVRSSAFVSQLESAAGARPTGAIAHHTQPLGLNGVDNGLINGSRVQGSAHQAGHSALNSAVNSVPYGTWIIIKP